MPSSSRSVRALILLLATVLAVPLVALFGAAPAFAAPGAVTGTVVDALDAPLSGVTVEARNATTAEPAGSVATVANGGYTLPLADGSYTIWFMLSGYTSEPLGGTEDATTVSVSDGIAYIDGDPVANNELGSVTLVSTTERDVLGTVTAGGDPYEGVVVQAFLEDDEETVVRTATSAANGTYTIRLPLGRYHLEYVAPAPRTPQYANRYYTAAPDPTVPAVITVPASGPILVNNANPSCTNLCAVALAAVDPNQTFPVAGRAVDANGEGLNGLTVQFTPLDTGTAATATTSGTGPTAGDFTALVRPGNYNVSFSGPGAAGTTTFPGGGDPNSTVSVAGNGTLSVNGTVVPSGEIDSVEVPSTPHSVTGRVVASAGGAGLAGITVRAVNTDAGVLPVTVTTNGTGNYDLPLPIGSWLVDFTDNDGTGTQYAGAVLGGGTGKVVRVSQTALFYDIDPVTGVPVTVTALPDQALAEANVDTPYDVLGDLDDANGDPVAGITVTATPATGTPISSAPSNAEGRYTLQLKAGSYRIRTGATTAFGSVDYKHGGGAVVDVVVATSGTVKVGEDDVPLRLLKPMQLAGVENFTITGKAVTTPPPASVAIPGITATAFLDTDSTTPVGTAAVTSSDGTYTLSNLKIGTYLIHLTDNNADATLYIQTWFAKSGNGSSDPETATSVKIAQGGIVSVDNTVVTTLADTRMVVATDDTVYPVPGNVSDANGDRLLGVLVNATPLPGRTGTASSTTTSGDSLLYAYTLSLKAGTYKITFSRGDFFTADYPSPTSETSAAEITVDPGGKIRVLGNLPSEEVTALEDVPLVGTVEYPLAGRIVGPGDVNPGPVTVQVADADSTTFTTKSVTIGADGRFTNLFLKVGTYKIRFLDATPDTAPIYVLANYPTPIKVATVPVGQATGSFFADSGGADPVPLTPAGTLAKVTFTEASVDATYILAGTTSDWDGVELNGVLVEAVDTGSGAVRATTTTAKDTLPPATSLGDAGVYRMPVKPGSYWLRFSKPGYQTSYLPSFEDETVRVVITVTLDGRILGSEEDIVDTDNVITDMVVYFPAPAMKSAPTLKGKPLAGTTVTATTGTWDVKKIEDWASFEWFLDGKPADQYSAGKLSEKFEIPAKAVGQELTFRLGVFDPDFKQATAYFTSKPVKVKGLTSKVKVKASYKKGKLTVKVTAKGVKKLSGKIVVLNGKKKIAKGKLSVKAKGVVVIKLGKLKPGKYKLVVVFTGKGLAPVKDKVKVKIK